MNPLNPQQPTGPSTPTPEEDAAIQALENNDTSNGTADSAPSTPTATPTPTPTPSPTPAVSPSPAPIVGQDVRPSSSAPVVPLAPVVAKETIDSPLSEADPVATTPAFNPFEAKAVALGKKKRSKKPLLIVVIILVLALLGGGGYYVWSMMQPAATPATDTSTTDQTEETTLPEPVETPEDVTEEVEAIEADLNTIDESQLQDETISDQTLNQ